MKKCSISYVLSYYQSKFVLKRASKRNACLDGELGMGGGGGDLIGEDLN